MPQLDLWTFSIMYFYPESSFFLQAIPSHSVRRSLFEQYVKTRAEEERREKRAAHKAAIEGFRQLLDDASTVNLFKELNVFLL